MQTALMLCSVCHEWATERVVEPYAGFVCAPCSQAGRGTAQYIRNQERQIQALRVALARLEQQRASRR
jgi:hypothetical protein